MVSKVESPMAQGPLELLDPWQRHKTGKAVVGAAGGLDFRMDYVPSEAADGAAHSLDANDFDAVRHYLEGRNAGPPQAPGPSASFHPASRRRSAPEPVVAGTAKQPKNACQISPPATPTTAVHVPLPAQPLALPPADVLTPTDATFDSSPLPLCRKRARPTTDVDGPDTAAMSSKKRRLRLVLVTSRLSRPFSQPASHIMGRDAIVSGERRFVKLAAYVDPARPHTPNVQSSMLRRAAVLNRVRMRVCREAAERGSSALAGVAANAALLHHGLHHFTGARFIVSHAIAQSAWEQLAPAPAGPGPGIREGVHHTAGHRPTLSPPATPKRAMPPVPVLRPLGSPEMRPQRLRGDVDADARMYDVDEEYMDEEEVAFPTAEHESRYESSDDPDDVYSDFSLIFGGSGSAADDEEEEEHSFEEFLDELDGIPCAVR